MRSQELRGPLPIWFSGRRSRTKLAPISGRRENARTAPRFTRGASDRMARRVQSPSGGGSVMRRWSSVLVHVRSLAVFADWATVFLLTALVACDGSAPPATATPTLESVKDCGAGWQPFTTAQPWDEYSPLVYQAGTLYYTSINAQALLALPTNGAPPATLASVVTNELWIEGDHLLLSQGNLANQIYSVPLSGGTPQLVLDGGAGRTSPG